jgi:hypothetical protein
VQSPRSEYEKNLTNLARKEIYLHHLGESIVGPEIPRPFLERTGACSARLKLAGCNEYGLRVIQPPTPGQPALLAPRGSRASDWRIACLQADTKDSAADCAG